MEGLVFMPLKQPSEHLRVDEDKKVYYICCENKDGDPTTDYEKFLIEQYLASGYTFGGPRKKQAKAAKAVLAPIDPNSDSVPFNKRTKAWFHEHVKEGQWDELSKIRSFTAMKKRFYEMNPELGPQA